MHILYFALALLAGSTASLGMAPHNLWFCTLGGIAALFLINIKLKKHAWHAGLSGWLFGFGYFVCGLYWIGNALLVDGNEFKWAWPLAAAGLPALLAFFPALACYSAKKISGGAGPIPQYFFFVALMALSEWLRGHIFTGFPWNLYGYSWGNLLPVLQILYYSDVYFLTLLTIAAGAAIGLVVWLPQFKHKLYGIAVIIILGAALYCGGAFRISLNPTLYAPQTDIKLIQADIRQEEKWEQSKLVDHFNTYIDMSRNNEGSPSSAPQENNTTLIIWPETATNYLFIDDENAMNEIAQTLQTYSGPSYLIAGALLKKKEKGTVSNSLIALNKDGKTIATYDKSHLVPFGEYIPFQDWIPLDPVTQFSGLGAGDGIKTIELSPNIRFSPLICYEILFPGHVADQDNRPDFIINVTNDAWYGISAGPYQHLQKAVFRAIEEGLPVIRVAGTGFSAIIDPYGRILTRTHLFRRDIVKHAMPLKIQNKIFIPAIKNLMFFIGLFIVCISGIYYKTHNFKE